MLGTTSHCVPLVPATNSPHAAGSQGALSECINTMEPTLHLESFKGFLLHLKQHSPFSTWLLKLLMMWFLSAFQPSYGPVSPAHIPGQQHWTMLLNHSRTKPSPTSGTRLCCVSISVPGWHLPIDQVPAENHFLRTAFLKHFPFPQTHRLLSTPVVLSLFHSTSHN